MEPLARLHAATIQAQQQDDLPDFLAARIFALADGLAGQDILRAEVEELIEQLGLYDTYGQTGYIGMGVSNIILEATIDRMERALYAHTARNI